MRLNTEYKDESKNGRNQTDKIALKIMQGATPITTLSSDSSRFEWVSLWSACFDENIVFYVPTKTQAKALVNIKSELIIFTFVVHFSGLILNNLSAFISTHDMEDIIVTNSEFIFSF